MGKINTTYINRVRSKLNSEQQMVFFNNKDGRINCNQMPPEIQSE